MNQLLMDFITKNLYDIGKLLKEQIIVGEHRYIDDSKYDRYANHKILSLLLPNLLSILNTSEMLVISEEADKPYIVDVNMHIKYPDNISAYPGWVLVLDPICGSTQYIRGIADYVISVGIINNLNSVISAVYQPNLDELFYAEKGHGVYLNGRSIDTMSTIDNLEMSFLSIEHRVYREAPQQDMQNIVKKAKRLRTAGTCSLEMCYVACGRLDGLIKLNQSFYDYLPGSLFILESNPNNTLVKLDGITPIFPIKKLNRKTSFLATNGIITSELASYTKSWNK